MKRTNYALAVYFVIVFLCGGAIGVFGTRLYSNKTVQNRPKRAAPEDYRKRYIEEMKNRLKLDDSQVAKLNTVLDETRERYRELHERTRPELKGIQDDQVRRINELLSQPQKVEYQKMREEREKKMREDRDKKGPRRGGPPSEF